MDAHSICESISSYYETDTGTERKREKGMKSAADTEQIVENSGEVAKSFSIPNIFLHNQPEEKTNSEE